MVINQNWLFDFPKPVVCVCVCVYVVGEVPITMGSLEGGPPKGVPQH
jgi:hypothetical protein